VPVRVIVGAQWGDEGKGKIVDWLCEKADVVARYAGGPNAGHTVVVGGKTFILHLLPSGVVRPGKLCVVGNGVVLNPETFFREMEEIERSGIPVRDRLFVSERAHIITRYHLAAEACEEDEVEGGRIGTTRRGIGPAYRDKIGRCGLRVVDLVEEAGLEERLLYAREVLGRGSVDPALLPDPREEAARLREFGVRLRPLAADVSVVMREAMDEGKEILAEGAQGTLLDVDHGTYPFVTSSNPVAGGACVGLGIGPTDVDEVIGVVKAYATRVGRGPFPTELPPEDSEALRAAGAEYGATTGRPRRCGWLDTVALRHSVRVNGLTSLVVTKLDVLDGLSEIKVCVAYELEGRRISGFPASTQQIGRCRPVYETVPGWAGKAAEAGSWDDLPEGARTYLARISELAGVPVTMVSVGSGREKTLVAPA